MAITLNKGDQHWAAVEYEEFNYFIIGHPDLVANYYIPYNLIM